MKPGVSWVSMHDLATRIILNTLIKVRRIESPACLQLTACT